MALQRQLNESDVDRPAELEPRIPESTLGQEPAIQDEERVSTLSLPQGYGVWPPESWKAAGGGGCSYFVGQEAQRDS